MSSRKLSDWLTAYLQYTENTESPEAFDTWTGISLLAGALERRVYMKWGHDTIYPNMYIVLVGPSGKSRKGTAMNIGKSIIKDTKISFASESITREALIRKMKSSINSFQDLGTGQIKWHCSIMVMSEELSVFLGQEDTQFLSNLTDWYDSRDKWTYETKNSGTDTVEGVCLNMLGATAPDWISSMLPQEALGGGFTSRIIFITEKNKGKSVAEPIYGEEEIKLKNILKEDIDRIMTIAGEMKFTPDAKQHYIDWYHKWEDSIQDNKPAIKDPRFAGYLSRRATHLRKLSMIMSISRSSSKIITIDDLIRADKLLKIAELKMENTFGGLGTSRYGDITQKILTYIMEAKVVSRSALLRRFYRDVDPQTLRLIEETLEQMKIVQITRNPVNNEVNYTFIGESNG